MMFRSVAVALVLLVIGSSAALAAPVSGKVATVRKQEVRVVVTGKLADWVKKGARVRFLGGRATIAGIAADTVSITTPNAAKTKPGAAVTFDKPNPALSGC